MRKTYQNVGTKDNENSFSPLILSLFIISLLLFSMSIGCKNPFDKSATSTITGKVVDNRGKPIEDAIVLINPVIIVNGKPILLVAVSPDTVTITVKTNSNGIYTITDVSAGTYKLSVSKSGYITSSSIVTVSDAFYSCESGVINKDMKLENLEEYVLVTKWGSAGNGDGQFYMPGGIAVDGFGNVYIADLGNYRIQKFTSEGTFMTKWGTYGSGDGQFFGAGGIAVDGSGNVYVADEGNSRIQKFTSDGTFIIKWDAFGSGDSQFRHVNDVAIDNSGNIYVADGWNHRIQKFTSNGAFIIKWQMRAKGLYDEYLTPIGITIDDSGNVYISGTGMFTGEFSIVEKFTSNGTFITQIGSVGSGEGQYSSVRGITVDDSGNVYICDNVNLRIQKFSPDGILLAKWGLDNGRNNVQDVTVSYRLAVDSSGNVYVSDMLDRNGQIKKFKKK